jgi:hypothetical protein
MSPPTLTNFVLCVKDGGYPESLEVRSIYRVVPDEDAIEHGLIRVIDESGEDYLYPKDLFVPMHFIVVPRPASHAGSGTFISASSAASSRARP